jgi:predicted RNA-binding Zn-ribbon protein involved in translation (DUF1610 family)/DNA-binding MarR family transcriptional regulator
MAWALDHQQTGALAPEVRLVLVALADHADPTGKGAWPAASTLAGRLGVTVRSVRRSLSALEQLRLIGRGDQRVVSHVRKDRRPVVWDLAVDGRQVALEFDAAAAYLGAEPYDRSRHGVTPTTPRGRDDSDDTAQGPRGDTHDTHGVTPASPKPNTQPTNSPSVEKVTQGRVRATASQDVPRPRTAVGYTQANCPACGERIYRTHKCKASALDPRSLAHASSVRELTLASPDRPVHLHVVTDLTRGQCPTCGKDDRTLLDETGLCALCTAGLVAQGTLELGDLG